MEAWLRDGDGKLVATFMNGQFRVFPGANLDAIIALTARLHAAALWEPQSRLVFYGGGYAYGQGGGTAGVD
jgi:hypothetical protein